jgi:hypothetical protein
MHGQEIKNLKSRVEYFHGLKNSLNTAPCIKIAGQHRPESLQSSAWIGQVPCFPLMADGKNEHGVVGRFVAVQRDVSGVPSGDDQFSQAIFSSPSDQWMVRQNLDGFCNEIDGRERHGGVGFKEKVSQAFEIGKCSLRID